MPYAICLRRTYIIKKIIVFLHAMDQLTVIVIIKLLYIEVQFSIFQSYLIIYFNKDRRVFIYLFIYLFRVTLSVISMGENSCPPYCGYSFKYLRK